MNNNVKILLAKLLEILAVFDWKIGQQKQTELFDKNNLVVY